MENPTDTEHQKYAGAAEVTQHEGFIDSADAKEVHQNLLQSRQQGYFPITAEEKAHHRSLNRKLDMFLLGFCALIYIFNGLDRSNIGNAQTGGFTKDLGIPSTTINTASALFFATYIPLAPLSTVIGRWVGQPRWLGIIGVCWGVITIGTAFVKTQGQVYAVRLLLGVVECGMYPTVMAYISIFYPRYDVAFRVALFYSCYAIATAFGGLIAYGCFQIKGSLYSWQYLFLIEGAGSLLIALITPFWLPTSPATAWFLTSAQREFATARMTIDSAANAESARSISKRDIKESILDWKLWFILLPNICQGVSPMGLTIFFPIVVQGLGYSGPTANLMTVPPYVVGTIFVLVVAYTSDHYKTRMWPLIFGLAVVMTGLALTIGLPQDNLSGRYGGLVVLVAGSFISSPLQVAWLAGNTPEPGMRTVNLGINGWGNVSGLIGTQIFLARYGPTYHLPLAITLGLAGLGMVLFAVNGIVLRLVNRHRAKIVARMTPEEIEMENRSDARYGDKKHTFVYGL